MPNRTTAMNPALSLSLDGLPSCIEYGTMEVSASMSIQSVLGCMYRNSLFQKTKQPYGYKMFLTGRDKVVKILIRRTAANKSCYLHCFMRWLEMAQSLRVLRPDHYFDCRRRSFYLCLLADKGGFLESAQIKITHRCSTALKANMTAVVLQSSTQPLVRFSIDGCSQVK